MDDTQASMYQHFISQATSTVKQAIGEDTAGNVHAAIGLYVSSTVLYMKALEFVQDEDFKRRVKAEVSKYLQRAQDLRTIEKQNMTPQEIQQQNQYQQLQQIQQQQQTFRDQRQNLKDYWNAPPQPLPDHTPHSSHPSSHPQPAHPHSTSQPSHTQPAHAQPLTPPHAQPTTPPHAQPPHTQPSTQIPHAQPPTQTQQSTGLLGSLLNKVKKAGNPPKDPQKPSKTPKKQKGKKQKAKRGSDDESEEESEEETSEEEEDDEEDEDEEGNERVEQLVKEVEQEEGKGEKEDKEEGEEEEGGERNKKEKEKETGAEYLQEIPDEETLKTIDKMLLDEEKRVNAELKQTSVQDDRIADKIASLRYGMGLGLDNTQEGEIDDEVLKDLIMESRIAALGEDTTPKKPAKAKKKSK